MSIFKTNHLRRKQISLGGKTFIYSMAIACLTLLVVLAYLFLLLPSLYIEDRRLANLDYAKKALHEYTETGHIPVEPNLQESMLAGVTIPHTGYKLSFNFGTVSGEIEVTGKAEQKVFDSFRNFKKFNDAAAIKQLWHQNSSYFKDFFAKLETAVNPSFKISLHDVAEPPGIPKRIAKLHYINSKAFIAEFIAEQNPSGTRYTSLWGIRQSPEATKIVLINSITPRATDILPTISKGVPLIVLLIFLIALGGARLYAGKIVKPIKRLAGLAEEGIIETEKTAAAANFRAVNAPNFTAADLGMTWANDYATSKEVAALSKALRSLFSTQSAAMHELIAQNKHREVFLRAAAHRMKTPVAAASLLLDGMIGKIGKYADYSTYLPQVKHELNEIIGIVNEINELGAAGLKVDLTKVDIGLLCQTVGKEFAVLSQDKGLQMTYRINGKPKFDMPDLKFEASAAGLATDESARLSVENEKSEGVVWLTDALMLRKILENLVGNAVRYTAAGGEILIDLKADSIRVINRPARIASTLLPVIFEPFVTGHSHAFGDSAQMPNTGNVLAPAYHPDMTGTAMQENEAHGHGLGLYIAKYFAKILNLDLIVHTDKDTVTFTLINRLITAQKNSN